MYISMDETVFDVIRRADNSPISMQCVKYKEYKILCGISRVSRHELFSSGKSILRYLYEDSNTIVSRVTLKFLTSLGSTLNEETK